MTVKANAKSPSIVGRAAPRSDLRQERSRQRQKRLLDAAEEVVAEVGLADMSMREVGRRAEMPIASVYHYFPSAPALVRALAERQLEHLGLFIADQLQHHRSARPEPTVPALARSIIADAARHMETMPALPAIWNALRSTPELRELDRSDTFASAARLAPIVRQALPQMSESDAETYAVVLMESVAINLMFALESPEPLRLKLIKAIQDFVGRALAAQIVDCH